MAGENDHRFWDRDIEALGEQLSEFAHEKLGGDGLGVLVTIIAPMAERLEVLPDPPPGDDQAREARFAEYPDLQQLIDRVRGCFTEGNLGVPTMFCIVPPPPYPPR